MSKAVKIAFVVIVTLTVLLATIFFLVGYFKPKPGGIRVNTNPVASVYVNGSFAGKTPFTGAYMEEQIDLKLVPEGASGSPIPYETKVKMVPGIETVVDREFGPTEDESSGDVISFERIGGKLAGLVVISTPDNAQVWIDGTSQGFTPYSFNSITTGPHKITVKAVGYKDRTLNIKTLPGLKLTVYAKLASGSNSSEGPTPSPTPQDGPKAYVVIGDTPTGFLRMRTKPGTDGDEIAELKTGQKYLYVETDSDTGWYRIQYQDPAPGLPNGIRGWVSNQYSKVIDEEGASIKPADLPSQSTASESDSE
jgi:hypothetical protein